LVASSRFLRASIHAVATAPAARNRSPVRQLAIGVLSSVVLSVCSSLMLGLELSGDSAWPGILILLLWCASFVAAAVFVFLALTLSFRARDTIGVQIRVILVSYLGGMLVFTGLYFSMALIGDRDYALAHYAYYQSYAKSFPTEVAAGQIAVPPFAGRQRAFAGIDARLWGTLDDELPLDSREFQQNPQAYRVALTERRSFRDVAVFRTRDVWSVLLDCQHLSIMTIATVGYGNISPSTWYSKLATNLEALTGTALLVVALALLLGRHSQE
jgi:hypothetical protein